MYLSVAIFLWYLSSALCNSTSKHLLLEFEIPYLLSSVQFVLAYVCSLVMRKYFKGSGFPPTPKSEEQQTWLYQVAICFALGFTLVNTGLHVMHVSINETLRAGEPVVSVLLAVVWLKEAHISRTLVFTLIPIVCGIALSSYSNADFKFQGLALMFGANLAFSYRSILVKRLRLKYDMTASDILLYSLRYGSLLQIAAAFGSLLYSPSVPVWVDSNQPALMLLNGCCFFAYNQVCNIYQIYFAS